MNRANIVSIVAILAVLAAAGNAAARPDTEIFGYEAWHQAVTDLGLDPNEVVYPFEITDEMEAWAEEKIRGYKGFGPETRLEVLQRSFFDKGEFHFEYDQVRTLTAEEAFSRREGNCMSFTSLFVSLARSSGIPTFLLSVKRQPEVIKEEGLVVVNRHVVAGYRAPNKMYVYDFYVTDTSPYLSQRVIDDVEASAIYHTNIGGYAIRVNDVAEAKRNLDLAVVLAPRWAPAWVNLGVARARLDDKEGAFQAFQRALEVEPGNSSALVNLAKIYRDQGREEEAENAMRAAAEGTRNPFTLIAMADAEMTRGNYDEARQYLRRARWWYGKEPDVYHALSRLARHEGDEEKAEKYAQRAVDLRLQALREAEEARN
jgi:Flp pilus assembly protein TadD